MIFKSSGHKNQILFLHPFQNIWAKAKIERGRQDKPSRWAVVLGSLKQAGRPELPVFVSLYLNACSSSAHPHMTSGC